jgi:protein-tyrosine-phosphatase
MQKRIAVIFVSRRNSLRSILAEACLLHLDPKRFSAYSCGQPGQLAHAFHPAAIGALKSAGMEIPNRAPRSWDEFARSNSPLADFIITLDAATEPLHPPGCGVIRARATDTGYSPPRMSPASLLLYFAAGSTRYQSHVGTLLRLRPINHCS